MFSSGSGVVDRRREAGVGEGGAEIDAGSGPAPAGLGGDASVAPDTSDAADAGVAVADHVDDRGGFDADTDVAADGDGDARDGDRSGGVDGEEVEGAVEGEEVVYAGGGEALVALGDATDVEAEAGVVGGGAGAGGRARRAGLFGQ